MADGMPRASQATEWWQCSRATRKAWQLPVFPCQVPPISTQATTKLVGPQVSAARPTAEWTIGRCSASLAILSQVAGSNWVAVGDAAWSCDPLTAQGITKALADGIAAADALAVQWRGGGREALWSYQTASFARFTANLRLRAALYEVQGRWPDAPFWRKRRPMNTNSSR